MFKINANLFAACARFVSFEETRFYLNGIYIEPLETGVRIVATDGSRLFAAVDPEGQAPSSAIVYLDRKAVMACKPGRATHAEIDESVTLIRFTECNNEGEVLQTVKAIPTHPVGGTFPDWGRVVPDIDLNESTPQISFCADVLKAALEASAILNGKQSTFTMHARTAGTPVLVTFEGDHKAVAVIAPVLNATDEIQEKRRAVVDAITQVAE